MDRRDFLRRMALNMGALAWSGHSAPGPAYAQAGMSETLAARLAGRLRQWEQELLPEVPATTALPTFRTLQQWAATEVPPHRPFAILKLEGFPIYALKFADLETQDLAGDRLSAFAEIRRGTVLADAELRKILHGYSAGKDFRMATVAAFFTAAIGQRATLNVIERRLLTTLTQSKLLASLAGGYTASPKDAALISVAVARADIVEHEFNHAVYFLDEPYRTACIGLWNSLELGDRGVYESLMIAYGFPYNFAEDSDLATREFVAFFRATAVLLRDYLPSIGKAVAASKPGEAQYRLRPYFGSDGRLTPEWQNRVTAIGRRLRELERLSEIYRRLSVAPVARKTTKD